MGPGDELESTSVRVLGKQGFKHMQKIISTYEQFRDDENGAAMVEYSILIGIIAGAAILAIVAIGGWVSGRFTGLCGILNGKGVLAGGGKGTCVASSGTGT